MKLKKAVRTGDLREKENVMMTSSGQVKHGRV